MQQRQKLTRNNMIHRKNNPWTIDEIEALHRIWESASSEEVARKLGRSAQQVSAMAGKLRKAGIDLPQKRKNGYLNTLIQEYINRRLKK